MRFTLSWLKRFLKTEASLEDIAKTLTMTGLEVEDIDDKSKELQGFEVAEIIKADQHPDADKLRVCEVKTKDGMLQIVCGAPNARAGIKVVLAKEGVIIPNGGFKIRQSKIRGVDSCGMLCSYDELGIGKDSSGIIELPDDAVIGEKAISYLGKDDPVIHINITPNRADALGVYGIARDLAASGVGILTSLKVNQIKPSFTSEYSLTVSDKQACPLFAFVEVRNINNKKSPKWLRDLLDNIGIGSISPVVDITNYISYSFGQPMHAYDAAKISDGLTIDTSSSGKILALNGKEYAFQNGDIVIKDDQQTHCIGGIIGGQNSSCSPETTSILLEAASFASINISKTGRRLMVDTDSRYRFERNVDRQFTLQALALAVEMVLEICGGEVSEPKIVGDGKIPARSIDFPVSTLVHKTGLELEPNKIVAILTKLGFSCNIADEVIKIEIPSWRYDVSIKEDIIEEIVRIYGYDKLPEIKLPEVSKSKVVPAEHKRLADIKRIMAANGYDEVVTWSFMDSAKAKLFSKIKDELMLQNPISSDLDYMRPSILPNLLNVARNNINRSIDNLSIFEVGPIFNDVSDHYVNNLCAIRTGHNANKNSHQDRRAYDVYDIKADLASVFELVGLDINKCQFNEVVPSYYHPTRSLSVALGKNIIAYFGQVHPKILKEFDIEQDVFVLELVISQLPYGKEKFGKRAEYNVSDYQMVKRDFAFVIDKSFAGANLINFILNVDKKLIKAVEIFDIYIGDKIDPTKKSIALSVTIQDSSKTLEETEISELSAKIINGAKEKFGATLR
ncbi:MAG: phenylalanine--tRNA ligase subunit beta [Rickettsiales bacterium]|nr:phenylalanine--tRNA ligase subunit beta [Rickettsiales bacterium]